MQLFKATQKPESATVSTAALRDLDDFPCCSEAAARLSELLQQQNELEVQLAAATRRMYEICQDKPIPPRDHDREVNELSQRLARVKAEIHEAQQALRLATDAARMQISRAAKPDHDELRRRVIRALEELRDALDAEQHFRDELDFSPSVITAVRILDLDCNTLAAVIEGQKGYLG